MVRTESCTMKPLPLLVAALLCLPAHALSLADAEKRLDQAIGLPVRGGSGEDDPASFKELEAVFRKEAGKNPKARRDLGKLLLLQGRFGEAATTFAPGPEAKDAKSMQSVASQVERREAKGYKVLKMERFREGWALLEARPQKPFGSYASFSAPIVLVTNADGSRVLYRHALKPLNQENVNQFKLWVRPLSGNRGQDLAVECTMYGASWAPSTVYVFGGPQFTPMLEAAGDYPLWIDSLGETGHFYVGGSHCIGSTLSHAEQPRWTDVYGFDGAKGGFAIVNHRFPQHFKEIRTQIEGLLKTHPDDWDLRFHLGQIQEFAGENDKARVTYDEARARIKAQLEDKTIDAGQKKELRAADQRIQSRQKGLK